MCPDRMKNWLTIIKPGVPQRYLLLLGALVWTTAGTILLYKGYLLLRGFRSFPFGRFGLGVITGILFYLLLFSRISLRHTRRILGLQIDYPCMFSFFNIRSYLLMAIMISGGILLRKSGLFPDGFLVIIYLMMGVPLLLSSYRFYQSFFFWDKNRSA